ncbi:hypothetical protein [Dechloromonas sp. H13]|uniref:hypothetical protein n=1 Tax=Dechloromonas sp. H13 TaxID=2570193 RepID=UPI0012921E87|nr:hypothetical protein [Dechloromonas sp. H13]
MIYAINYDLCKPGRDYDGLYGAIKGCGGWWHYLGSTWLVDTNLDATGIYARLKPHLDSNDNMLIIGVTRDYNGWLPQEAWNWINERVRKAA